MPAFAQESTEGLPEIPDELLNETPAQFQRLLDMKPKKKVEKKKHDDRIVKVREDVIEYKFQSKSLIDWRNLDLEEWLSFDEWKKEQEFRDKHENWRALRRAYNLHELLGKVVKCYGQCRHYRGEGFSLARYKSRVREGDILQTRPDSYAWVYMMDGSLMRISPNTSITFQEFNITDDEFFFFARVNYGNVLWLGRSSEKIIQHDGRQTDTLFNDLEVLAEILADKIYQYEEDDLFALLEIKNPDDSVYEQANIQREVNNASIRKVRDTKVFFIMENGSVSGTNINLELISLLGGKAYIKRRSDKNYYEKERENAFAEFHYRGLEKTDLTEIKPDMWYEVDRMGESISEAQNQKQFGLGEFVTKRIPRILLAREVLFAKDSGGLFIEKFKRKDIARAYGYRLWTPMKDEKSDMSERYKFLVDYTRRIETTRMTNLLKLKERYFLGEKIDVTLYSEGFYAKAIYDYASGAKVYSEVETESDREGLNSTTKPLWKIINAR